MVEDDEIKETVYDKKGREKELEDDEVSAEEEGFMRGYDEAAEDDKEEE